MLSVPPLGRNGTRILCRAGRTEEQALIAHLRLEERSRGGNGQGEARRPTALAGAE